MKQTWSKCIN